MYFFEWFKHGRQFKKQLDIFVITALHLSFCSYTMTKDMSLQKNTHTDCICQIFSFFIEKENTPRHFFYPLLDQYVS